MNIDDLTIGNIKEIKAMTVFGGTAQDVAIDMFGKYVIVRTYSAGCWFGILSKKSGAEVILCDARRMWRWCAAEGISLSACALYGIKREQSKIVEPVPQVWLEAIEIIPCLDASITSIGGAPYVKAE